MLTHPTHERLGDGDRHDETAGSHAAAAAVRPYFSVTSWK